MAGGTLLSQSRGDLLEQLGLRWKLTTDGAVPKILEWAGCPVMFLLPHPICLHCNYGITPLLHSFTLVSCSEKLLCFCKLTLWSSHWVPFHGKGACLGGEATCHFWMPSIRQKLLKNTCGVHKPFFFKSVCFRGKLHFHRKFHKYMKSAWLNMNTSQLMSLNNALSSCFITQLQVPSLIPSGPLETWVSPRDEQDARTAHVEVLGFKTEPIPCFQVPVPFVCSASVEVGHCRVASTDWSSNHVRVQLHANPWWVRHSSK